MSPGPRHSPISLSRWPRARVPARKQTLARRQTAPVPLRRQFFWMTLMAGGSTVSDVLTCTIWRELAARGQCHRDAHGDGDGHPCALPGLSSSHRKGKLRHGGAQEAPGRAELGGSGDRGGPDPSPPPVPVPGTHRSSTAAPCAPTAKSTSPSPSMSSCPSTLRPK